MRKVNWGLKNSISDVSLKMLIFPTFIRNHNYMTFTYLWCSLNLSLVQGYLLHKRFFIANAIHGDNTWINYWPYSMLASIQHKRENNETNAHRCKHKNYSFRSNKWLIPIVRHCFACCLLFRWPGTFAIHWIQSRIWPMLDPLNKKDFLLFKELMKL